MRPRPLDPIYFGPRPWARRIKDWVKQASAAGRATPFLAENLQVIRQILTNPDTGPRMVINIGADALLSFLESNDYRNIYEMPVVGGKRRLPTKERVEVDRLLALGWPASKLYFGAVALDGSGVRFYGDYCMAIRPLRVQGKQTRTFDRDSYDLLQPPLSGRSAANTGRIVNALKGGWDTDLVDMLMMKMLPRLPAAQHLITVGNVSGLVMSDQEFVEVHLMGKIGIADVEEIRQSPYEAAVEAGVLSRKRARQSPSLVEMRWVSQRHRVLTRLHEKGLTYRVVTVQSPGHWT